ncbi:hypothetical protein ACI65C_006593 [Semiaphis heraclei]
MILALPHLPAQVHPDCTFTIHDGFWVRNHTSRVQRSDATRRVREYIDTLNDDGNLLMFLQRAGHMMDGYLHGQVGPQP